MKGITITKRLRKLNRASGIWEPSSITLTHAEWRGEAERGRINILRNKG